MPSALRPAAHSLALAIATLLPLSALSQPEDGLRVVVSATRQAQRTNELLSDVTLLTRHDIAQSPATSLPELLGSIAGVGFTQNGGVGASASIFVRGTNSNHVVVLIDGQRVSSATTGTTAIEHLPLEQIDRIEILRGPASSLYGADALGGVIQIFTRSAAPGNGLEIFAETGRYGSQRASASFGGGSDATRYRITVGRDVSGGISSIRAPRTSLFNMYNNDDDGYRNSNLSLRVDHRVNAAHALGVSALWVDTAKHFDAANCNATSTVCTPNFDNRQTQQLGSFSTHLTSELTPLWRNTLRVGRSSDRNASGRFDPSTNIVATDRYQTTQDQASWQNDLNTGLGKVLLALDWRNERVTSTQSFLVSSRQTSAALAGYSASFGNHDVQLNARVDAIERLGHHRSGSLAYGYRFSEVWRARAAMGRAFHAPTFNELYWPVDQVNFFQGNPNLRPERGVNRELALNYERGTAAASLTVYRNEVSDLLNFVSGGAPTFIGQYENVNKALLKGVSLGGEWATHGWTFKGKHDVLSARDVATGRTLQRRVPRTSTVELRHASGAWDYGVQVQRFSSRFNNSTNTQTLSGYSLTHLDARYRVNAEWSLQARLTNLFDDEYVVVSAAPSNDYATPGRALFVGVRYTPR